MSKNIDSIPIYSIITFLDDCLCYFGEDSSMKKYNERLLESLKVGTDRIEEDENIKKEALNHDKQY